MRLLAFPKKIIETLENESLHLIYFAQTFICILLLRDFFESFSQASSHYLNLNPNELILNLIHFALGFITIAAALCLTLFFATKEKITKILRVLSIAFALILLSPLLDMMFSGGQGQDMMYLGMLPSQQLSTLFFTFYKDYAGVTLGIKIELALAFCAFFIYCLVKRHSFLFALIYTFIAYIIIFTFSAAPLLLQIVLPLFNLQYEFSSFLMLRFYLMLLPLLIIPILYFANKTIFLSLLKDFRWLRILHYWLAFCLGITFAILNGLKENLLFGTNSTYFIANFLFCSVSILAGALYSIIQNNIHDQAIDKISNPKRPLITGQIDLATYKLIACAAFCIALIYAWAAGFRALFLISIIMASYHIYSAPPLRLKRIFIFSKFMIALNFLAITLLGYSLLADSVRGFPVMLIPIYLIGITLTANFIDIKDKKGDAQNGIITIANYFPAFMTKAFLSIATVSTYLSFYLLIPKSDYLFLIVIVLFAALQIHFVYQKEFNEKSILLVNSLSMTSLIIYLLV